VAVAETGNHPLWLATENGMEYLGDMDDEERAYIVINKLAHPDYRDWLKEEVAKCYPWGANL
jgi:acyl-CoA hydrolase